MRRVLVFMFTALLIWSVSITAQAITEEEKLQDALKTGQIIRLHVIAAGDDEENQRIKLCVRDKVLTAWRDKMTDIKSCDDMMDFLRDNRQALADAALAAAREEGFEGDVTAKVGVFTFPDRWYGSVLVPAGNYNSLRIVLGSGEGKNWWCVLFPNLCLSLASSDTPPAEQPVPQPTASSSAQTEPQPEFSWWVGRLFSAWPLLPPV